MKNWNQNTFKYFIAFDLYLMATQALKHKLFFAAVVFFEELLKTTTGSVHFEHLWNTTILYDLTKKQLESAKMIHDYSLLTYGQYGKVHRCNNETFQAKFRDFPMVVVDVSVLDRRQKITDKTHSTHRWVFSQTCTNEIFKCNANISLFIILSLA